MTKIQFYPLDITYKIIKEKPIVYLFGRTKDNKQICVMDEEFQPYFFAVLKNNEDIDDFKEKIIKIELEDNKETAKVTNAEIIEKRHLGKKKNAVKIFVNNPKAVPLIRNIIKEWEVIDSLYEYDIPFTRRYLLDKKIRPLVLTEIEGELVNINSRVPVLKAEKIEQLTGSLEAPRILAFDIETYNPLGKRFLPEKHAIVMISFYGENYKKVITWKRFKTDQEYIEFVDGEVNLINRFKEIIESYKPDFLVGYYSDGFDFPYIITRAKKYNIPLDINLDYSEVKFRKGKTQQIQLTGIVHIDIFKFISKVMGRSLATDSYSLQSVAHEILGENKQDVDINRLSDVWDNAPDQLEEFCKYNLHDSLLAYNLCIKVFSHIEELVKIIGLPIHDINRMGFSQLVEWYLFRRVQEFNELAPNKPHYEEIRERRANTYKGAFVYEPKPGLYKDIIIFDFRSLYPTIISSHNICLSTLNCICCEHTEHAPTDKKEYWFCKKNKGFIPQIIEDLITRRMRIKDILKEKPDDLLLQARSDSLKLLANAFYGYLGFFNARWYCLECARSVTAYSRYHINKVIDQAKEAGFNIIYSDTDSIFLTLEEKDKKQVLDFVEKINENLPGLMELEYEGHYPSGIFVSAKIGIEGAKKKYALLDEKGNVKIKGFETVRRNWSFIAKQVQEEILNIILKQHNAKKALEYAKNIINDLRNKKIPNEKVIIHTQLQKEIKEYTSIGPHVAIAKKLQAKGMDVGPGTIIEFIVTSVSGIIREKAKLPEEVSEGEYDSDYYINHQIVPSVERIFNVLGFTKQDLLESKDQSKLGSFF